MSDKESKKSSGSDIDQESDQESEEENEVPVSKEFEENVIKFIQYDDLIRKKTEEISELKKKRDPCKKFVLDYLDNIGQTTIDVNGGKLRKNKFTAKQQLTTDIMKDTLITILGNPQTVEQIVKLLDINRPIKERVDLKRTFERSTKGKKKKPKQSEEK